MHIEHFEVATRFCGPPRSGNGGYVCGRIASPLQGPAAVRLRAPPPLNVELRLESADNEARLFHGETVIGEAQRTELDLQVPPSPSMAQAEDSAASYLGFKVHPFPGCFVCGPERRPIDGMRIFPGTVAGSSTLAAPWSPDPTLADEQGHVKAEFLWSALDCTGGFAVMPTAEGVATVLGELTASLEDELAFDERCVVIGWPLGAQGRKRLAGSAIYAADGRLIARARAVWLEVPARAWG